MIFTELVKNTDLIFDSELRLPRSEDLETKISNEYYCGMRATKIFDYRRWQAKTMGFVQLEINELIELFYKKRHTDQEKIKKGCKYEWYYNHHLRRDKRNCGFWYGSNYYCYKRSGLFHWLPFQWELIWSCRMINLNQLESEIPSGIMLKILRIQALKIFTVFYILEPVVPKLELILIGTMWELPPQFRGGHKAIYDKPGYIAHFFLSQWC